nr:hypothetical protein 2 [Pseudomonadaceae bacterium]
MLNIAKEVARMRRMSVDQLREKYAEVFGEATRSRHKEYLIRRIAWRMQAIAEGGLPERARRRAAELADDADLRATSPRVRKLSPGSNQRTTTAATKVRANTELLPGTILGREYKGQSVRVTVLADGFEWEGERYRSLSAVAKAVTGSHWSGHRFFGIQKRGAK